MAISKERLEELIRQKATIYSTHWQEEVDLSLPCEINELEYGDRVITRLVVFEDDEHAPSYMLDSLTEDIEGAKWDMRFKRIPRTDYLDLPTWEEFIEKEEVGFYQKYGRYTSIKILGTKYIVVETSFERYYTGELTKENYTRACEKARELFLGENK